MVFGRLSDNHCKHKIYDYCKVLSQQFADEHKRWETTTITVTPTIGNGERCTKLWLHIENMRDYIVEWNASLRLNTIANNLTCNVTFYMLKFFTWTLLNILDSDIFNKLGNRSKLACRPRVWNCMKCGEVMLHKSTKSVK